MTPEEIQALLGYASAIDPRIRRNDPDERMLQVRAWHKILATTPFDDAREAVDRHYAAPDADALMPGDVKAGAGQTSTSRLPAYRPMREVLADLEHQVDEDRRIEIDR